MTDRLTGKIVCVTGGTSVFPFPSQIDPKVDFMKPEEVAETLVGHADVSAGYVVPEVVLLPMIKR